MKEQTLVRTGPPRRWNHIIGNTILYRLMLVAISVGAGLILTVVPVLAQGTAPHTEAIVLVNSASDYYQDFSHYIQPYLDHFGVPYQTLNIATTPVPTNLSDYALIIIGHRALDPDLTYLSSAEQTLVSSAVYSGSGLVNFDNTLATDTHDPIYPYAQSIFSFTYQAATPQEQVEIHSEATLGTYIIAAQPTDAIYIMSGVVQPLGVVPPTGASTLAALNGQPLLVTVTYGQGRALQWTSYDWVDWHIWGPMHGFDDLIWRGLVWAARKPFVLQGLPPLVTFRDDDSTGPYDWVVTANQYGFKPWLGLFFRDVTAPSAAQLKTLVDTGQATAAVHSFDYGDEFSTPGRFRPWLPTMPKRRPGSPPTKSPIPSLWCPITTPSASTPSVDCKAWG